MDILKDYKSKYELYNDFGEALIQDISDKVLKYERLNTQIVSGRLKDPTSLSLKIQSDSKYTVLNDVTDLLGIRIVTTYQNEITFIVKQLTEAFEIDQGNSSLDSNKLEHEFGYSSVHLIISNAKIESFKSYGPKFKNLKAEVQIRTILQHAWAEISHKIDYKAREKPDVSYRRKLFRVSALLELADQEFSAIREDIIKSHKDLVPRKGGVIPDTAIERESLQAYIMESDTCNALDQKIANITDSVLHYSGDAINKNFEQISKLEIKTLKQLDEILNQASQEIIKAFNTQNKSWIEFLKAFPESHGNSSTSRGVSITYLYFNLTGKYD